MEIVLEDQVGRRVVLPQKPQNVVSLVPSQTELLCYLGLENLLGGITRFCVHPRHLLQSKFNIGGTKSIRFSVLENIHPDLIIGNKEENTKEELETLWEKYPVWITDIITLKDSFKMIGDFGRIFNKTEKSKRLINSITEEFKQLGNLPKLNSQTVLYFIWRKPFMVAGGNCFIDSMLEKCGLKNAYKNNESGIRYHFVEPAEIQSINPDLIFLSSEPFPFKERHVKELKELCPKSNVVLVDGEMFSWYGSRLLYAPKYFKNLLKNLQEKD